MGQDQDQCSEIFSLSYKNLPTQLKPCFLYFGLFPEDHEIKAFELINLWVAEGFVKSSGTREVEDVGEDFLNHLIARNLIQVVRRRFDGRIRTCRVHDILHDLCIRASEEINFFKNHDNVTTGNSATRVRRITAQKSGLIEYISSNSQHVNLRTVLYFNDKYEWVKISRELRLLRVLRLDKIKLSRPNDIGNFCHLTYLQLRDVHPGKLPSTICNLKSLLTLDVQTGLGLDIPIGIWKMRQLRHLILSVFINGKVQQIDVSLPYLQSLHLVTLFGSCDVEGLRWNNLTSLRKLAIKADRAWAKLELSPLNLLRCENLHKLSLGVYMKNFPDLDDLFPNLAKLSLKFTELVQNPLETLKKLPKLKILKLGKQSYKARQIICSGGPDNFPQLEVLKIHDLILLEELIVEEGAMPRLKKLSIFECDRLTGIPERFRNITTAG
ncbi:Disease resistance RPP8-like protein [Actinidia chinensis var. chinensis]|uniref:Disease resistance RPP8-like protein n=1 Tax=Actinidia chinensis var. chinensis TaxID=1590841 RepID=A0A2R6P1G2_ACTCC|nr:Disease resistance RPP8-like protein [Actinidia chinensis var. chinensis]